MVIKRLDKKKLIDRVYKKYKNSVNMTYTELKIWNNNPLSRKASLNRDPIKRNLKLLSKNKSDWNLRDIGEANKVISYLARAKKIKRKKGIPINVLTPNEIALKNWAFDVYKKNK